MREDSAWEGKSRSANQRTPIVAPRGGRRGNRPGVTLRRKIKRRACFCGSLRHERTSTREKKCWMRRTRRALLMEDGTCAPLLPLGERVVPSGGAPNGRNGNYNYFLFSFSPFFFVCVRAHHLYCCIEGSRKDLPLNSRSHRHRQENERSIDELSLRLLNF